MLIIIYIILECSALKKQANINPLNDIVICIQNKPLMSAYLFRYFLVMPLSRYINFIIIILL